VMREGSPLYRNDAAIVPEGHMPIQRNLAVPIAFHGEVIGLFNLANKNTDYTEEDRDFIVDVAARIAPVLYARIQRELLEKERTAVEAERLQSEALTKAINVISVSASSTFDVDEILHRILMAATEALGTEASSLVLRDGDAGVVKEVIGLGVTEVGQTFAAGSLSADVSIVEEPRPIVIQDALSDDSLDGRAAGALGIRSLLIVPVIMRGAVMGVMAFSHLTGAVRFTAPQVQFATELVRVATIALDNAALYEHERRIADTLQEALLVPPEPIQELEVSYHYLPASDVANVGGDFFDVFVIDSERTGILIGDVSGKGLEAARHTSLLRSGARAYALENPEPASVLSNLNTLVCRSTPPEAFATVFFGVLNRFSGILRYCGAGHPPGLVRRSTDTEVLKCRSAIVGAFSEARFEVDEAKLARGDLLVLFTDGIIEARRGREMFGEARVVETVAKLDPTSFADAPQAILDDVLVFSGGEMRDDIIVLCVRRGESADYGRD